MEKNLTSPNADNNLCIKYVMNELDPSEIVLVEKALDDDDNLLIEIESLRRTWRRLERLPEIQPPDDISMAVLAKAGERRNNRHLQKFGISQQTSTVLFAVAAMLILSVTLGLASMYSNSSLVYPGQSEHVETLLQSNTEQLSPWVDNQEVLRLNSFEASQSTQNTTNVLTNFPQLRLIDDQSLLQSPSRQFHLTRTTN